MSKRKKKADPQTLIPFTGARKNQTPPHIYRGLQVMESIKKLLREQNKSLEEMVEWMSAPERRHCPVSISTARTWFAPSKEAHWPNFLDLALMCDFLGSCDPLNKMMEHLGYTAIDGKERRMLAAAEKLKEEIKHQHKVSQATETLTLIALEEEGATL